MSKVRKAQTQELIPYNGADQAIDLGAQNVTTTGTITAGLFAGPGGGGGAVSSVNSQTGVVVLDTDDIDEGSINLYFSDELAQDAIGSILADSSSIDFTYTDGTPEITAIIKAAGVTNAMLAGSIAASKLVGTDIATVGTLTAGSLGAGFTTVAVARGGTGGTTFTANRIIIGNGTSALSTIALGTANQLLGMTNAATSHEYKTLSLGTTAQSNNLGIVNAANSIVIHVPDASTSNRGVITTGAQSIAGAKTFTTTPISTGGTPTNATDLTIKSYVDAGLAGVNPALRKESCDLVSTTDITLSGEQTIDGVMTNNTRVLVNGQTSKPTNGIYISTSGAWVRASDYDTAAEVKQGNSVFVTAGTTYIKTQWFVITPDVVTLGSDDITFTQAFSPSNYTFTQGTAGTDFAVNTSGNTITSNLPDSSATSRGALTSADWSTFSAKAGVSGTTTAAVIPAFTNTTGTIQNSGILVGTSGANKTLSVSPAGTFTISGGTVIGSTTYDVTVKGSQTNGFAGGSTIIQAGDNAGSSANGGALIIRGGNIDSGSNLTGIGGSVSIYGGSANLTPTVGSAIGGSGIKIYGTEAPFITGGNIELNLYGPFSYLKIGTGGIYGTIDNHSITTSRTYVLPDASGTFAVSASGGLVLDSAGNMTASGLAQSTDIQIFSSSGTWTKPSGTPKTTTIIAIGGGGGGGSGRKGAAATVRSGGAGGGGGGYARTTIATSLLGATETVTIGTGGSGGAAVSANTTPGNAGAAGGITSFGTTTIWLRAGSGGGGAGGTTAAASGGSGGLIFPPGSTVILGSTGASSSGSGAAGSPPLNTNMFPGAGGSAGGITTGNVASIGGAGAQVGNTGVSTSSGFGTAITGGAGGAISGNAGNGTASPTNSGVGGSGGGGGGSSITTNGGAGGNGGYPGGGGGGGGSATNSVGNSGEGGDGAAGWLMAITYY